MNIGLALQALTPDASWKCLDDTYETLVWESSDIPKPTEAEIAAKSAELEALLPLKRVQVQRIEAYVRESDPLFFKAQRGEATMQEWQDKVAEIKARYPKPE